MPEPCPNDSDLRDLLEETDPTQNERIESHVAQCSSCQSRLDTLTRSDSIPLRYSPDLSWKKGLSGIVIEKVGNLLSLEKQLLDTNASRTIVNTTQFECTPEIPGYEILGRIGKGGTAIIYKAFQRTLRRVVAIKIMQDHTSDELRSRFRREAESIARLDHPGIIKIYETGEVAGMIFMALEYEEAGALSNFLNGTPQPAQDAVRFLLQVVDAIHAAHEAGLIHRDLKPGNLLLHTKVGAVPGKLESYDPKVTDFGLVKLLSEQTVITVSEDILGTPSYMAPEQVRSTNQPISRATDIYSLGTVLYELLTGRPPFKAATAIDTAIQVQHQEPVPPSRLIPGIPRDLETICLKCLEKSPGNRYTTADTLAQDLRRFLDGRPVSARPVSKLVKASRWMKRNPRQALLGGMITTMILLVAAVSPIIALRESALRKKAENAEVRALAQFDRAELNLNDANNAIWQSTLLKLSEIELHPDSTSAEQQLAVIEKAMPILEKARSRDPFLPTHRQRWGIVLYLHGRAARMSGQLARAEIDLGESASIFDKITSDLPMNHENFVHASFVSLELAHLDFIRKESTTEQRIRDAIERFERVPSRSFEWKRLRGLAECYKLQADFFENQPDKSQDFVAAMEKQVEILRELSLSGPVGSQIHQEEINSRLKLASVLLKNQRISKARIVYDAALASAERSSRSSLISTGMVILRINASEGISACYRAEGNLALAIKQTRNSLASARNLVELQKNNQKCLITCSRCELALAQLLYENGEKEAGQELLDSCSNRQQLITTNDELREQIESLQSKFSMR